MEFPATDRVIYETNPLTEVVCQFRFPRLLAIDEGIPAQFQKALGQAYPFVETRDVLQFQLATEREALKRVHYDFHTEDRLCTVTLCSEFLAVKTAEYRRWEEFEGHIRAGLAALFKSYPIQIFTRLGLRYVNIISKKSLGLDGVMWTDLIRPSALGLLAESSIPIDDFSEMTSATVLNLSGGGKATIRSYFRRNESDERGAVFSIDSDFFDDNPTRGADNAIGTISRFNRESGRVFRWLIRDQLHDALKPTDAGSIGLRSD